jgi:endonuclease YncB( thermonuclease family)
MIFMYDHVTLDRIIDGDTARLIIDLGFDLTRGSSAYRFARINAPELGTVAGVAAKTALEQFIAGKVLRVESLGPDKYGRYLIELYAGTDNVNDWMLANQFAVYMS